MRIVARPQPWSARLMSGVSVTDEYWYAHEHLGFTWDELCEVALMGFQSAFLPHQEKMALLEQVREEIDDLPGLFDSGGRSIAEGSTADQNE